MKTQPTHRLSIVKSRYRASHLDGYLKTVFVFSEVAAVRATSDLVDLTDSKDTCMPQIVFGRVLPLARFWEKSSGPTLWIFAFRVQGYPRLARQ